MFAPSAPAFPAANPAVIRNYTAEELSALTPDQLAALLQQVNQQREQANARVIQAETQLTALQQQLTEIQTKVREQFNVSTAEELQQLIQTQGAQLSQLFGELTQLTQGAPTPQG